MLHSAETVELDLHAALPQAAFRPLSDAYLTEPRGRFQAAGGLLVAPSSTQEVATVLHLCNRARVAVITYGGGTGLVGGQVAGPETPSPVILSMERMTAIRTLDPVGNVLVAEAGAILADIQTRADQEGRLFPLSLAAQGSARIGGNLATNAGGATVLRYGNARDLCLGIEAVLPDGSTFSGLHGLRKDNTGYDLRHLMIGAEGTLGVITAAALKLFPKLASEAAALIVVETPKAALALLSLARAELGEAITAFELISGAGLRFLQEVGPEIRQPFATAPEWMVLIDLGLSQPGSAEAALEALFEKAAEAGLALDGALSQSAAQRAAFWALREALPEANRRIGSVSSHDISVPLHAIPAFIAQAPGSIAPLGDFRINCFGHVGDGNLHWNVFPMPGKSRADHEALRDEIKRAVHDLVHSLGGSVSAEHGIGRLKVSDLERYGDPGKLRAMRAIKAALDPHGIMNPGAVLRSVES